MEYILKLKFHSLVSLLDQQAKCAVSLYIRMATKNVRMCVTAVAAKRLDRLYRFFGTKSWPILFMVKIALNGFPMAAILNI